MTPSPPMTAGCVVAFGELLVSLTPRGRKRLVQADEVDVRYTGSEANVAVALASLGQPAALVSTVPEDDLGQACVDFLRRYGVSTSSVVRSPGRLGCIWVEHGAGIRPTRVLYDRAETAFTRSGPAHYNWPAILDGADWLHFSGTALLGGEGVSDALRIGLRVAAEAGVRVSCDVNYRSKLWTTSAAGAALRPFLPQVDVLFGAGPEAAAVLGFDPGAGALESGRLSEVGELALARFAREHFGIDVVAGTRRSGGGAERAAVTGVILRDEQAYVSRDHVIDDVVERIGAGDAFAAGVIYGLRASWPIERCVEFAAAACCLKHSVPGDLNLVSVAEVDAAAFGLGDGRVER